MVEQAPGRLAGTEASERRHEAALEVIPGGVSHGVRYRHPYPIYVDRAEGASIWDVDGNRYVDFWNNHSASLLGHADPDVVEAVVEQVGRGLHYGAANEITLELAHRVRRFVPSADRIRFCVTGTEATMYAVRLARAWTGRDLVAKAVGGWHGGNTDLAHQVAPPFDRPTTAGLPAGVGSSVTGIDLADREAVVDDLDRMGDELAAVIVDPRRATVPGDPVDVLKLLAREREERGFLLIIDEVVTGFRTSPGSYQARHDLRPDLTTLGKVLGGGMPVAAVTGRAALFEPARPDVRVEPDRRVLAGGGTFSHHPLAATAGVATLDRLEAEPVHERTEELAERARNGLRDVFEDADVPALVWGMSSLIQLAIRPSGPISSAGDVKNATDREALLAFQDALGERGYFFNPGSMGNVSYAHTDEHVDGLLDAAADAVPALCRDGVL